MSPVAVTRERISARNRLVSRACQLPNPGSTCGRKGVLLTHDGGDKKGIVETALLEEQARVDAQEGESRQLLGANGQGRAEGPPEIRAPEAVQVRAQDPAEGLGIHLV